MEQHIYLIFAFIFFTAGFFYLIFYKKTQNPFFIALFFFFGYFNLYLTLYHNGNLVNYSYLYGSMAVTTSAAFPLLYLAIKKSLERNFIWQSKYLLLFLPALLRWIFLYPYYLMNAYDRETMVQTAIETISPDALYNDPNIYVLMANYTFFCAFIAVYLYKRVSLKSIKDEVKKKTSNGNVIKTLMIWGISHTIVMVYMLTLEAGGLIYTILDYLNMVSAFLYFVFLSLVPYLVRLGIFSKPGDVWNIHVFTKSRLNKLDIENLEKTLLNLIQKEKIYLNKKLSLKVLAKKLGISIYQTSELINVRFKKNSNDFINHYRVQQAMKLMKKKSNMDTSQICYKSGFNTYSSFLRAFQKETESSPDNWRKNQFNKND
ncbi:MAG: helix-turn-helix domain-containing protein [Spirochaetia bacterium]|nr:helix-turn-helix domain-containing protein [Spirochaetia bacterium]